jgi:perosamine synthetase
VIAQEAYKKSISLFLSVSPENVFLYWKGRVALYALLKAAGIKQGDEVLLSGLTCVVVPNAIKYLGARPVYVDVNPETFNPTYENYLEKTTHQTKALIIQNTFGLSSDVEAIVKFAKDKNLITIEDCTHGFGGTYENKPNGSYCDAAIFSTQWNKPFSTGIGGFCVVNNRELLRSIILVNKELIQPDLKDNILLSILIWAKNNMINDKTFWLFRDIYRWLSRNGLVIGSSQGKELQGIEVPTSFFKTASKVQVKYGLKNIRNLDELIQRRKQNAVLYSCFLKENKKKYISEKLWQNHSFLVYPILVKDRLTFRKMAEKAHIKLGDWFISPLHPVQKSLHIWDMDEKLLPKASYLSKHLVNLPTSDNDGDKVLTFLKNNINNIL